jgi:hypothetical protein
VTSEAEGEIDDGEDELGEFDVGQAVGVPVGLAVGLSEGLAVGIPEGLTVGLAVGLFEGEIVDGDNDIL